MIRKVLVAYDGSKPADKAFEFALDLASKYSAELIVLSVARLPEPPEDVETEAIVENATERYEKLFAPMKEQAAAAKIRATFEVKAGHPAEQIIYLAEQEKVDVIVMGHRGHSFLARWLLGSISKRVLSYAHCSVIIVR